MGIDVVVAAEKPIGTFQSVFAITKVAADPTDKKMGFVQGIASAPVMDDQDEIVSPVAVSEAIPVYMRIGNIREMHQLSAVGKVHSYEILEDGSTRILVKVVDPVAWLKVVEGVYTGFSIGGESLESKKEMVNGKLVTVHTKIKLTEISLVDRPSCPAAVIEMYKSSVVMTEGLINKGGGNKQMEENNNQSQENPTQETVVVEQPTTAGQEETTQQTSDVGVVQPTIAKATKSDEPNQQPIAKAAAPDPQKLVELMQALRNQYELTGNIDGAQLLTASISGLIAAAKDQMADQSGGDGDGDTVGENPAEGMAEMAADAMEASAEGAEGEGEGEGEEIENAAGVGGGDSANNDAEQPATPQENLEQANQAANNEDDDTEKMSGGGSAMTKAGRPISAANMQAIQAMHDLTCQLGAMCKASDVSADAETPAPTNAPAKPAPAKPAPPVANKGAGGMMSKSATSDGSSNPLVATLTKQVQDLTAKISKLEKQPAGGALPAQVRAIEKGGGNGTSGGQVEPLSLEQRIEALKQQADSTTDAFLKQRLAQEISVLSLRQNYRFANQE